MLNTVLINQDRNWWRIKLHANLIVLHAVKVVDLHLSKGGTLQG